MTLNADGSFTYSPDANFNGSDSFTYWANDGSADSDTATLSITVNPLNDAPVAVDDGYTVDQDTTLNVLAAGVLNNDSDVDGDTPTAVIVVGAGPNNGTLTLNGNGSFGNPFHSLGNLPPYAPNVVRLFASAPESDNGFWLRRHSDLKMPTGHHVAQPELSRGGKHA